MATADPPTAPTAPPAPPAGLVDALRDVLASRPAGDPDDATRLACLLVARERFAGMVGERPAGALEGLPPPFEAVVLPARVRATLDGYAASASSGGADPASIGARYEATLGTEARGGRGQFFTPPPAAAVLVRWALDGSAGERAPPRVLDPAVGTGTFLLEAYRQLRDGSSASGSAPPADRLIGVDVDAVALHLAGLRLAAAAGAGAPDSPSLHHASFFDCAPAGQGVDPPGVLELPTVDAVVGNPPFIRAEALAPSPEHYRRHLAAFGPPDEAPLLDGPGALSRRSDAYVYFVTHATRFLRPGGRLAMVLPTKWLMSEYGEGLRRFLRDRYRIHAIVGVRGRTFDALVDTVLLFAERDDTAPATAPLRLLRVDEPRGATRLLAAGADGTDDADGHARTAPVAERGQGALTAEGSLARYLEAPADLLALLESTPFVRLDELAEVARGTMTGANRVFFVDADDVERFGIEPRFLRPAVKSLRGVDRPAVGPADVDRYLLDVHPFVAAVRPPVDDTGDPTSAVKGALAAEGHDGLLAYLDHAEAAGWHAGPTCQSRPVWFDLGPLRAPAAFIPKLLRERVFAIRNLARAVPSNAIDGIWPAEGVDPAALLAVVNASVGRAAMEVTGRDESGLLQLMTYETASLPTLDVRLLSADGVAALGERAEAYAATPAEDTLAALDESVVRLFDLPLSAATVRAQAAGLRDRRLDVDG